MATCRGKTAHGIEVALLVRMLCTFDARETFILEHKCYPVECAFGSDDLENAFSVITRLVFALL